MRPEPYCRCWPVGHCISVKQIKLALHTKDLYSTLKQIRLQQQKQDFTVFSAIGVQPIPIKHQTLEGSSIVGLNGFTRTLTHTHPYTLTPIHTHTHTHSHTYTLTPIHTHTHTHSHPCHQPTCQNWLGGRSSIYRKCFFY